MYVISFKNRTREGNLCSLVHLLRAELHLRPRLGDVVKVFARRDADRRQRRVKPRHVARQLDQSDVGRERLSEDPAGGYADSEVEQKLRQNSDRFPSFV